MRRFDFRAIALSAAAAALLAAAPAAAQEVTITLAHMFPKNHLQGGPYEAWAKMVNERSHGRIKVNSHPASSLITGREALNAVKTGSVQASNMTSPFQTGTMPFLNAISLPFMFDDHQHFRRALKAGLFDMLVEEYAKQNIKLLNYYTKGSAHIFHKKKFIITPADFKGANLRGLGGYMTLLLDELGANAVTLPTGEVTTALQRGVVDGILTSCIAHIARGWAEQAKYVSAVDLAESGEGLGMNLDFFDKLAPDLQKIVVESAKDMEKMQWDGTLSADAEKCPADWRKYKLPNRTPTAAERDALRKAAHALYAKAETEVPHTKEVLAIVEKTRM